MNKHLNLITLATCSLLFLFCTCLWAAPDVTNLQGVLKDADNIPVSATVDFRLRVLDGPDPINDNQEYYEEHIGVEVINGIYNISLGMGTNATGLYNHILFIQDNRYLEISVRPDGGSPWERLEPLQPFASVAFSLQAGNADTIDNQQAADLEESAEIDADINAHTAIPSAHHVKTTSFSELIDKPTDDQIPDDITIKYADSAGDADTVDGLHASQLAPSVHGHGFSDLSGTLQSYQLSGTYPSAVSLTNVATLNASSLNGVSLTLSGHLFLPDNSAGTGVQIRSGSLSSSVPLIHTYGGEIKRNFFAGFDAGGHLTDGSLNTGLGHAALNQDTIGSRNTAVGANSLGSNTTGSDNSVLGFFSMLNNSTGSFNTALGSAAMVGNTTGEYNTAGGYYALFANKTASNNTAFGASALQTQSYSNNDSLWDTNNTAIGFEALHDNQPTSDSNGYNNTATGAFALRNNTTGSYNTATGVNALLQNTVGGLNTAYGAEALKNNSTGNNNTATGYSALNRNTTGLSNTANGINALSSNTVGNSNTAVGSSTLTFNSSAGQNTAVGDHALYSQSYLNGGSAWNSNNTAVGFHAMYYNQPIDTISGKDNTAVGSESLYKNDTGNSNVALGYRALYENREGYGNTAGGYKSLVSNWGGYNNSALGTGALFNNISGFNNTAIGYSAGGANSSGNNNTFLGAYANAQTSMYTNAMAIGYSAIVNGSNRVRIGNTSVTQIGGEVGWSNLSDIRRKKDIESLGHGLDLIMGLRPVVYRMKNGNDRFDMGFIAQDVEVLLGTEYNVLGIGEDESRTLSLRYTDFIAPLTKAVQEQQGMIRKLQNENRQLREIICLDHPEAELCTQPVD